MIDKNALREILETYRKYGWILRRVLLTDALRASIGSDTEILFGRVPIVPSDVDGLWVSRPPKPGPNAWELRHLGPSPYALVEHIDEDDPDFEMHLSDVEGRLKAAVRRAT